MVRQILYFYIARNILFLLKDTGLSDVRDPALKEYYQTEIERFRVNAATQQSSTPSAAGSVMHKIASLRKEIARDKQIASYR